MRSRCVTKPSPLRGIGANVCACPIDSTRIRGFLVGYGMDCVARMSRRRRDLPRMGTRRDATRVLAHAIQGSPAHTLRDRPWMAVADPLIAPQAFVMCRRSRLRRDMCATQGHSWPTGGPRNPFQANDWRGRRSWALETGSPFDVLPRPRHAPLLTGPVDGRAGYWYLWRRLSRRRISLRWYAVAILTAPVLATTVYLALALAGPRFLPVIPTVADQLSLPAVGQMGLA
jgi:hypothetical protein